MLGPGYYFCFRWSDSDLGEAGASANSRSIDLHFSDKLPACCSEISLLISDIMIVSCGERDRFLVDGRDLFHHGCVKTTGGCSNTGHHRVNLKRSLGGSGAAPEKLKRSE